MGIDDDQLHRYLWKRSDRRNVIRVKHVDLAELLGLTKYTISVIFRRMEEAGRLRKIAKTVDGVDYLIMDPDPEA